MRNFTLITVTASVAFGCGPRDPEVEPDPVEIDTGLLMEVAAEYEKYADPLATAVEVSQDAAGCIVPTWIDSRMFNYDPQDPSRGMGVHVQDWTYPIDLVEAERPRTLLYALDGPTGTMRLAGLEWYFEPPGGEELEEQPTLFGYPMPGVMEGHFPFQGFHYDVHVWPYLPHDELDYQYFGDYHPEVPAPDWYLEVEPALFTLWKYHTVQTRFDDGYVQGTECIEGQGIHWANEDLVGLNDPFQPDTILTDVNGLIIGYQWTYPDDGNGPPTLFQKEYFGPDENGNYFLRVWMGLRTSSDYFAENIYSMSCQEPPLPEECVPEIPGL